MQCYYPLQAWYSMKKNMNGKYTVYFEKCSDCNPFRPVKIPCGQCIGCRLERARQWSLRCMHEASLHNVNSFITLTYDAENLPMNNMNSGYTLHYEDVQLFMKRLRIKFKQFKIRFYMCGEYGELMQRPHYHILLFGFDFADKAEYKKNEGHTLYTSKVLDKVWGLGKCWIGNVTYDSANYVARYILKKISGEKAIKHYNGNIPEFTNMSRRPGIASDYIMKNLEGVYNSDSCIVKGKEVKPAKYYDKIYDELCPEGFKKVMEKRLEKAKEIEEAGDNTEDRLRVKEYIMQDKINRKSKTF